MMEHLLTVWAYGCGGLLLVYWLTFGFGGKAEIWYRRGGRRQRRVVRNWIPCLLVSILWPITVPVMLWQNRAS